jgi:hypothetical protein
MDKVCPPYIPSPKLGLTLVALFFPQTILLCM